MKVTNYILKNKKSNDFIDNNNGVTKILSNVKMFYTFETAQTEAIKENSTQEENNASTRYEVRLLEIEIV